MSALLKAMVRVPVEEDWMEVPVMVWEESAVTPDVE